MKAASDLAAPSAASAKKKESIRKRLRSGIPTILGVRLAGIICLRGRGKEHLPERLIK